MLANRGSSDGLPGRTRTSHFGIVPLPPLTRQPTSLLSTLQPSVYRVRAWSLLTQACYRRRPPTEASNNDGVDDGVLGQEHLDVAVLARGRDNVRQVGLAAESESERSYSVQTHCINTFLRRCSDVLTPVSGGVHTLS